MDTQLSKEVNETSDELSTTSASTPSTQLSTGRWVATLLGLYLGALLYGLDTTIAADVQTAVYEQFVDIERLPWVGVGFPMASVSFILVFGRLYGLFNIKLLLLFSFAMFEIGSAVCGAAPTMNALIIGRIIAGIGGAGMYLGALTYVSVFGSGPKLPLYNALIGLSWGVGAILGPVVGGAFSVSSATWRWAFYINLPLAALTAPIYIFVQPSWTASSLSVREKLRLDWVGIVLNAAVFTLSMTALTFSGSSYSWNSATSIGLWTATGVSLIAWILQQYFSLFTTDRIFPGHFLKNRDMVLLAITTACAATTNATTLYYVPLYFAFTRGDSALDAAVRLLPFIIIFIFFIMIAGGSLPVVGRYAPYYTAGGALTLVGASLMFTIRYDTSVAKIYGYEVLIAAGSGLVFQNAYAVAAKKVPDKANAIGFLNVAQVGFIAIALAAAGCLYQNLGFAYLSDALRVYQLPEPLLRAALGGVGSATLAAAPKEIVDLTVETVAFTISRVFGLAVAASALLFVSSLFMKQEKLDLKLEAGG